MCKHSLESYSQRKAVEGETLVVSAGGHGGMFSPPDGSVQLACVIHGTKLTIEDFDIRAGAAHGFSERGPVSITNYIGRKDFVVTFIDGRKSSLVGADCIKFDELFVPVAWLKPGTRVYVGVKATLSDKLKLDEKSLRSVSADIEREEPIVEHQMPEHRLTGRRRTFDRAEGDD